MPLEQLQIARGAPQQRSRQISAMAEATPPPAPAVEGIPVTADIASLLCAGHTGPLNRTKRLKFMVGQAAGALGHEAVEEGTCRVLLGELKAAAVDVASYRWTTATAGAARLGAEGALDAAWVASTEAAVKAAEAAASQAPMRVALFRADHGDADGALQALRKVKERQTDASVAMAALPIIFGADLTKATIRSFAKEACNRLLKSPLLEQLEPSARAQVRACDALVSLSNRDYAGAAMKFAAVSAGDLPDDGLPGVVLPREVGMYGTVCALAALERAELQKQLLHSASPAVHRRQPGRARHGDGLPHGELRPGAQAAGGPAVDDVLRRPAGGASVSADREDPHALLHALRAAVRAPRSDQDGHGV